MTNTKKMSLLMLLFAAFLLSMTSCEKEEIDDNDDDDEIELEGIKGDMSAINFVEGTKYLVVGDLIVPEDVSVTIPAGVTLEFQEGLNGEAWFVDVYGSLYVMGNENKRVTFTASEELINSSKNQGIGQLWGGIIGTITTGDLVIRYTDILYAGGACREENAMALPATGGGGELSAGDASYGLYFVREAGQRQDGIFVLQHSSLQFTPDDGIRINGGKTLMSHNFFQVIGGTGGDGVNIKAGTHGDFSYNLFYNMATNSLKSADTGVGERGICKTNFYNNTIVSSGYRRAEPGRGAGLNYESDSYGECFNNLNVNTRFGLRLVAGENEPDLSQLRYGYNWYYGSVQTIVDEFYPTENTASKGLIGNDPRAPKPATDVVGGVKENDPMFVNFDPSNFVFSGNSTISTDPLRNNVTPLAENADFHLRAGSPALNGGTLDINLVHTEYTTLNQEHTFTTPQPSEFFGAFGTK